MKSILGDNHLAALGSIMKANTACRAEANQGTSVTVHAATFWITCSFWMFFQGQPQGQPHHSSSSLVPLEVNKADCYIECTVWENIYNYIKIDNFLFPGNTDI